MYQRQKGKRVSEKDKDEMVEMYTKHQMSIQTIAKIIGRKPVTISKYLKERGVTPTLGLRQMQPSEEQLSILRKASEEHRSLKSVSLDLNVDKQILSRWAKENDIKMNYKLKNHDLKEDFFEVIDTEEKAYLLGIFWTDGFVKKGNRIGLQLQKRDEGFVKKIRNLLGSDSTLVLDPRTGKEAISFEFASEKMAKDLSFFGVVRNKTYDSVGLPLNLIPVEFQRPFVRGLFDGDGGLAFKENYNETAVNFSSYHRESVEDFQKFIDRAIGKTESNKIRKASCWRCSWRGRRQVLKILEYLYQDAKIYLPRKYEKYQRLLKTLDEQDNDIV